MERTRTGRIAATVALAASSLLLVAASQAIVGATWDCDGTVTVTAEGHAISNVVIADDDGETKVEEPFEQVDEEGEEIEVFEWSFEATEGLSGVWVKAGNNRSGDGPGYGEWVELSPPEDCGPDLGTGPIQATLRWTNADGNIDDWDLYIIAPSGEFTAYYNRTSAAGGELDFDATCGAGTGDKVENIFFSAPTPGTYTVGVDLWSTCGDGLPNAEFTLEVKVDGVIIHTQSGSTDSDPTPRRAGPENEFSFVYGP